MICCLNAGNTNKLAVATLINNLALIEFAYICGRSFSDVETSLVH